MLIVCPSCASEYTIDPAKLGADGRTLRCAICRDTWFVTPDGRPAQQSAAEEPRSEAAAAPSSGRPSSGRFAFRKAWAAAGASGLLAGAVLAFPTIFTEVGHWTKAGIRSLTHQVDAGRAELEFRAVTSELIPQEGGRVLVVGGEIVN